MISTEQGAWWRDLVRHRAEQEALGAGHALVADDDQVGVAAPRRRRGSRRPGRPGARRSRRARSPDARRPPRPSRVDVLARVDHPLQVRRGLARWRTGRSSRRVRARRRRPRRAARWPARTACPPSSEPSVPPRSSRTWAEHILREPVIDLHCHVLPGIDDGPRTLDDSLALARAAVAAGTRTIVATPHVSWDWPGVDAARRRRAGSRRVNGALRAEGIPLEVLAGRRGRDERARSTCRRGARARCASAAGPGCSSSARFAGSSPGFESSCSPAAGTAATASCSPTPSAARLFQRDGRCSSASSARACSTSITAGALAGRFGSTVERFALDLCAGGLGPRRRLRRPRRRRAARRRSRPS